MTPNQAQTAIKELYAEASLLSPSALILLFEIDVGIIGLNVGAISQAEINSDNSTVFRFHNNVKLSSSSIFWQGNEYIAAPINAEGFDMTSKGVLPTPKLSINVNDEAVSVFNQFRQRIRDIGDLTGAKVTRIRTFAKFLDAENFKTGNQPIGFSPNPNSEFPRDVFYIDRKSLENKFVMEFELGSLLDVQGQKLPGRLVVANSCPAIYRGESCMYECNTRRNVIEHGNITDSILPTAAPAVANEFDETFAVLLPGVTIVDKGAYDSNQFYNSGDTTYLNFNNVNYYFVASAPHIPAVLNNNIIPISPPNRTNWIADMCSHKIRGCELRYGVGGSARGVTLGQIPFVGFPACTRFK